MNESDRAPNSHASSLYPAMLHETHDPFDGTAAINDSPALRAELRGQLLRLRTIETSIQSFAANVAEYSASLSNTVGVDVDSMTELLSNEETVRLNVGDTFAQLGDFAENLQHQLSKLRYE